MSRYSNHFASDELEEAVYEPTQADWAEYMAYRRELELTEEELVDAAQENFSDFNLPF